MSSLSEEFVFTVPASLLRTRSSGISFDFGSSLVKCLYRIKEDVDEVKSDSAKLGHLHGVTFLRKDFKAGLDFVLGRAHRSLQSSGNISASGTTIPPILNITGVGSAILNTVLSETLGVRLQSRSEIDCIAKAFFLLASVLPRHQLLEPFCDDALASTVESVTGLAVAIEYVNRNTELQPARYVAELKDNIEEFAGRPPADKGTRTSDVQIPLSQAEPDAFPCLVIILGSCQFSVKIETDGTFRFGDRSTGGGRLMLGVANYLAGCKTFEEFITLASSGNSKNVDQWIHEMVGDGEANEDLYSGLRDPSASYLTFSFGKTVGANAANYRREDLARSWLEYVVQDSVRAIFLSCFLRGLRRVFFVGGFTSHPLIRYLISKEMTWMNLFHQMDEKDKSVQFDFVRAGHHFAALGCMVYDLVDGV